jgi:hypothetical protein
MTWDIMVALITIVGSLIGIGTVLAKLIKTLTKLDVTLSQLQRELNEFKVENKETHTRIWSKLDNHDVRIQRLEDKSC